MSEELNNNGEKHLDEEQSEQLDDIPVIELLIKVNSLFTFRNGMIPLKSFPSLQFVLLSPVR